MGGDFYFANTLKHIWQVWGGQGGRVDSDLRVEGRTQAVPLLVR